MPRQYQGNQKIREKNLLLRALDICYSRILLKFYPDENQITTHLTFREKRRLMSLASKSSGNVYVEIGSYIGASACFIAAGIKKKGSGQLHCIDTWQNQGMTEGKRDTLAEFKKNTTKYKDLIIPQRGDSRELAKTFKKPIDFLFIDGDHSYESVRMDVEAWFPKLNPGALVLFHDIGWAKGVQQVIDEIVRPVVKFEDRLPNLYWAWL